MKIRISARVHCTYGNNKMQPGITAYTVLRGNGIRSADILEEEGILSGSLLHKRFGG